MALLYPTVTEVKSLFRLFSQIISGKHKLKCKWISALVEVCGVLTGYTVLPFWAKYMAMVQTIALYPES